MYLTVKISNRDLKIDPQTEVQSKTITMSFGKVVRLGGGDVSKKYVDEQDEKES